MPRTKKHNSRFLEENNSLFETSDMSYTTLHRNAKTKKTEQAALAESRSKKILAKNAPVTAIMGDDTEESSEDTESSWDDRLQK